MATDKNNYPGPDLPDLNNIEEDLDQYGVWVKVGPEEIEEDLDEGTFELSDLQEEDKHLTEEEEQLLGNLEEETKAEQGESEEDFSLPGTHKRQSGLGG